MSDSVEDPDIIIDGLHFRLHDKQEALSSILSAGQWAYTEYSSFSGPPKVNRKAEKDA